MYLDIFRYFWMYLDIHLNVVCNGSYGSHFYVWPLAAPRNDYIDEDLPDGNETPMLLSGRLLHH